MHLLSSKEYAEEGAEPKSILRVPRRARCAALAAFRPSLAAAKRDLVDLQVCCGSTGFFTIYVGGKSCVILRCDFCLGGLWAELGDSVWEGYLGSLRKRYDMP